MDELDPLTEAQIRDLAEESAAFAKANPLYTLEKVYEALQTRPDDVSLAQALVAMLNNAYAIGYISAKKESKKRIVLFPGHSH